MKNIITFTLITIFTLSSHAQELMELSSGITISNSISNNPESGTIRWTGFDFQGYDGNQWTSLTSASNNNSTNVMSYFIGLPNGIQTLLDAGETVPNIIAAGAQPSDFLGLKYLGGWIFQINHDGTGLMSTNAPYNISYEWGCSGLILGAINEEIGYGQNNTDAIIAACPTTPQTLHAAAVSDLWSPHNLSDWYLPSIEELELMHSILGEGGNIANFISGGYWSSTNNSADNADALIHVIGTGQRISLSKDEEAFVWPIRNF